MHHYRALIVSSTGGILRSHRIAAIEDQEAIEKAERLREDPLSLELWKDRALVYTFDARRAVEQK